MFNLLRIARAHMRNTSRLLRPHGLLHGEWHLLAIVWERAPIGVGSLAEIAGVERPTASRMIERLERRGLVRRTQGQADRRSAPIILTAKGESKLAATEPLVRQLIETYALGLRPAEREALLSLLVSYEKVVSAAVAPAQASEARRREP